MIHKIPPPALPASRHSLCQPGHRKMTSPPNHGALPMYLQQWPGEHCHRQRRPVRVLSSTTILLGVQKPLSVPLKDGLQTPLLRYTLRWVTHLALAATVVFIILSPLSEINWHLITPLGYPSPPASSSAASASWAPQLQLNPLLDSRSPQCLNFDIGALQFMPNMNLNGPAVLPPVTFIQIFIVVPPFKWPVNIHVHGPVTVAQVVQHVSEFLQGSQNAHDLQKSKVKIPSSSGHSHSPSLRDQNHPNGFHSGKRRIDLLGRHRIFRGLSPEPGSTNCAWVVHLSDRW